jgi:hypothetical protein
LESRKRWSKGEVLRQKIDNNIVTFAKALAPEIKVIMGQDEGVASAWVSV